MGRADNLAAARSGEFDVAIIGGGITGAGIFLQCCLRGWKSVLIDAGDFAGGTSSRSAKMIHGGLRYLEHFQVGLVREALHEREHLLTSYPHLVKPLPFFMPVYGSALSLVKMKVGLTGYDALAGSSSLPKHQTFGRRDIERRYPMLRTRDLKGGIYYYDALTNDARLTNEVIMQAVDLGGTAVNYLGMDGMGGDGALTCTDRLTGDTLTIKARYTVSAAGVWTDEVLERTGGHAGRVMKPSKGIHVVVDGSRFHPEDVLLIPCTDGRFLWICPWLEGLAIIGTTDTPYEGELREPGCTDAEIDYLLDNANNYLQGFRLTRNDLLSAYSGLRPLLDDAGGSDTAKMSRDYRVWWQGDRLLVIAGGKLTSFLSMADKVVDKLSGKLAVGEVREVAPPARGGDALSDFLAASGESGLAGRVRFFVRRQHAVKIEDVLTRRLVTSYGMQAYDEALVGEVAGIMAEELGWSDADKAARTEDYRRHWETMHPWIKPTV